MLRVRATLLAPILCVAACSPTGDDASGGAPSAGGGSGQAPVPGAGASAVEDNVDAIGASRFLSQATFGPSAADIAELDSVGLSAWLQAEFAKPQESLLETVLIADAAGADLGPDELAEAFWTRAIESDDQLRQRVGYALSQIIVASYSDPGLEDRPVAMANYMDIMAAGAFGNFRQLLENVTYSPAMAIYLTYLQNQKADAEREVVPDENYAREVMQLFTIGLVELNSNGQPQLDAQGRQIETYTNDDVTGLAKVFTGLSWAARTRFLGNPNSIESEYLPLEMYEAEHSPESKEFLGVVIPENTPGTESIRIALDTLFNHPNTAPFIARQMIQRLVTSNPSPAYVGRVANAFATGSFVMPNGQAAGGGGRGDMRAVVAAILLDPEARDPARMTEPGFGKIREPVIRFTHWARAFGVTDTDAGDANELLDTRGPDTLNQQAYRAPSVFNFYRPGFVAPGSVSGAAGLVAPELQITTASSVTGYANFMEDFITRAISDGAFAANYSEEILLADNPTALVDRLNAILTYGSLNETTRSRIISAVSAVTEGRGAFTRNEVRVHTALLFLLTSSDYIISR